MHVNVSPMFLGDESHASTGCFLDFWDETCSPKPGRCSALTMVIIIIIIIIIIIVIIIIIIITIIIIIFIFMRGQNSPTLLNNMLIGVIASTISP